MMSSNQRKQLMVRGFLYCVSIPLLGMFTVIDATSPFV